MELSDLDRLKDGTFAISEEVGSPKAKPVELHVAQFIGVSIEEYQASQHYSDALFTPSGSGNNTDDALEWWALAKSLEKESNREAST